jgi:hypothetical protein
VLAELAGQPTLSADICLGDNDDWAVGQSEFAIGDGSSTYTAAGQRVWDPAADETLDSGWVTVSFQISPGGGPGGVDLTVGDDGVTYDGGSYGYVQGLQFSAYAHGRDRSFEWRSIAVKFYQGGTLQERVEVPDSSAPWASTYGGSDTSYEQNVLNVLPATSSNNDAAIVTAQVHLSVGYMPGLSGDDVSGQINLFATAPGTN